MLAYKFSDRQATAPRQIPFGRSIIKFEKFKSEYKFAFKFVYFTQTSEIKHIFPQILIGLFFLIILSLFYTYIRNLKRKLLCKLNK